MAALATLSFGAVVGPEAPLIALGAGLARWAVRLAKRDAPAEVAAVIAAAGSFAAISTLLGSPLLGALLLMEAAGLGSMLGVVLLPGLLAVGVGALIFVGPILAAVFVAEIGDVTRFLGPEQLASWAGLTPKHHESDTKVHRGRITKQGSRLVRWAAVEAVQRAGKHTRIGNVRDRVGARRGRP